MTIPTTTVPVLYKNGPMLCVLCRTTIPAEAERVGFVVGNVMLVIICPPCCAVVASVATGHAAECMRCDEPSVVSPCLDCQVEIHEQEVRNDPSKALTGSRPTPNPIVAPTSDTNQTAVVAEGHDGPSLEVK